MPSNVTLTQFEPVVFMRGGTGRDARGRARQLNTSASPSHVRALLTLDLQKACKIRDIQVSFSGVTHTDWPEGIGPGRLELAETTQIFKNIVTIWSAKDDHIMREGRRRANSIGPGVAGMPGDEDWSSFSNIAATAAPVPDAATSQSSGNQHATEPTTLARSIAGVAARAGTAMMPATIRNELTAARKANKANSKEGSSGSSTARLPFAKPKVADRLSSSPIRSSSSGIILPLSFGRSQSPASGASTSRPLSGSSQTLYASSPTAGSRPLLDASDLPPTYDEAATPPASASAGQRTGYFDQPAVSSPTAIQNHAPPGTRLSMTSPSLARSTPGSGAAVHFDAGEEFATAVGRSATPVSPPLPQPAKAERKASGSVSVIANGGSSTESRTRKSGSSLKSLIGGLLTAEKNEDDASNSDWKLFKPGVYQFPVTVQLPNDLPPTLHADFGHNAYHLRALVRRVGALTSNLMAEHEVTLIHSPEDDGTTDATDMIVVQRTWENALAYMVVISGKTFPIQASKIPLWMKLAPLDKVHVHRITASIEERTSYFAKDRFVSRHEVPRRWQLLKLAGPDANSPLLPIISDASDVLDNSPLVAHVPRDADGQTADEDALSSLLDPSGPWELYLDLPTPNCSTSSINLSSSHVKSNVQVAHTLRVSLRVSRASDGAAAGGSEDSGGGKPKQFDIIIEAPITLTHSHTAEEWISLPSYCNLGAAPPRDGASTAHTDDAEADADREVTASLGSTGMARSMSDVDNPLFSSSPSGVGSSNITPRRVSPSPNRATVSPPPPKAQPAHRPRVAIPSPVAMRTSAMVGSGSGSSSGSSGATRYWNSSNVRSATMTTGMTAVLDRHASSGGGLSTNGAGAGAGPGASGDSLVTTGSAPPNGRTLTSVARELSRQWLVLSSGGGSGSGIEATQEAQASTSVGVGRNWRGIQAGLEIGVNGLRLEGAATPSRAGSGALLAANGNGTDVPPPDYRSAVRGG